MPHYRMRIGETTFNVTIDQVNGEKIEGAVTPEELARADVDFLRILGVIEVGTNALSQRFRRQGSLNFGDVSVYPMPTEITDERSRKEPTGEPRSLLSDIEQIEDLREEDGEA